MNRAKRTAPVDRTCRTCGAVFKAGGYALRRGYARYCSRPCSAAGQRYGPERFWPNVRKTDGCWEWTRPVTINGRPHFGNEVAARYAWALANGPIPPEMNVCHSCDNPLCVRADHLFLGTRSDNMRDMVGKRRNYQTAAPERVARGSRNGVAKLTEAAVAQIRAAPGALTERAWAKTFGVSQRAIHFVITGQTWRHVP